MTGHEIGSITDWHAHIYYDPADRGAAAAIREHIEAHYPVRMGRWHDQPVGPHPQPMYQVAFDPPVFPQLVPWLALNRAGLTVFIHPNTGDALADHARHAIWLGAILPLKLEVLARS